MTTGLVVVGSESRSDKGTKVIIEKFHWSITSQITFPRISPDSSIRSVYRRVFEAGKHQQLDGIKSTCPRGKYARTYAESACN